MHGFTITSREALPEIDGTAIEGVHEKSGARLLFLQNDDNNKSFAIGFRTPPRDDTGVFHILEHSVLCGSDRFPVKEPFVDLLKSSMQTFLNAMTFADKTLYPVASTNEQDLFNLMDVYLDAVFHPNIYNKRQIFEQEGWHYELTDDGGLVYNGVVYNEMKGALSDANDVLYDKIQALLFPGTCYAFESGGTPEAIPTLTYENYLDEHRRHYRTDNSYIILYGNLDIDRALAFLDERYLTPIADEQRERDDARAAEGLEALVPREIEADASQRFVSMPQLSDRCGGSRDDSLTVAVPDGFNLPARVAHVRQTMDTAPENACAACGYVIGTASERVRSMAAEILLDALFGSNEAPLKRALLDAGVAHDVRTYVSDALANPFALVQLQMPAEGAGERLCDLLAEEVRKLVGGNFDRELVEAAISHAEFHMREHDFGMSDGVAYAVLSLSGWLYDDSAATANLRYEKEFAELRELLADGYFEQLAVELFCENGQVASAEIVPTPGHSNDEARERLAEKAQTLTDDDRARIAAEVELLRELQEAPDSPEAQATLPRLSVADIDDAPEEPRVDLDWKTPITCVRHSVQTRGIAYAYRYFDLDGVPFEDLPYVSVLSNVLGKLDTARHTAAELDTLAQGKLGNMTFFSDVFERKGAIGQVCPKFVVSASALSKNAQWLSRLPREVMLETDFASETSRAKILDVLKQRKIVIEHAFSNSGHSCASARLKSYYTQAGVVREQLGNVGFYRFLCELIEQYDERADDLAENLERVAGLVFCDDRCTVSFAGSDADYDAFWLSGPGCNRKSDGETRLVIPESKVLNEAFVVPSDVCYVATGWDRRLLDVPYSGTWSVASRALSYDYLWNEVRVKGGAYGVGFQSLRSGNMRFYSYRDPHLDDTLARFDAASDWLSSFEPSQEALEGFIVATVAGIDAPVKPRELVRRQMGDFFTLHKPEERTERRREVIATTAADVRELAGAVRAATDKRAICVFGNREILQGAKADLKIIPLVG
ncbi:MAG: insulinase family protein [Eggerthellaceae bacterium]|nr:insulinase family protein [Eggerthellaceae bacterium]